MKDPAFLFYPNDYIGGTMGMTFEEKGAYMELLMMQFNRGHMTSHMIGQTVGQIWDKIQNKFTQDDQGLWYNQRLEDEINKRKAFVGSRRNNLKGVNQYTKKTGHMDGHMTSHMENENEDVNKDISKSVNKEEIDFEKLKDFYNTTCKELPSCQKLTPARLKAINARIKEHGKEVVVSVIRKASKSKFLNGENKEGWKANLDWIFNPNNFVKILEDNYQPKQQQQRKEEFIPKYPRLEEVYAGMELKKL